MSNNQKQLPSVRILGILRYILIPIKSHQANHDIIIEQYYGFIRVVRAVRA
jgi:hypothetical protein